jgi:hypothetical protein
MTIHLRPDEVIAEQILATGDTATAAGNWLRRAWRLVVVWATYCADRYSAAVMYEQLSGLSNSELASRGLSRTNLAADVDAACDSALMS